MLLPQNLFTVHRGQQLTQGLSQNLWAPAFRKAAESPDGEGGIWFYDKFQSFGGAVTSNVGHYSSSMAGGYVSYEDTGGSISQRATGSGVVRITTDTTDNDECWLTCCGNTGYMGAISDTAGSDKLTIFEAKIAVGQITDSYNMFVGLAEEGLAAADTVTDAGAMASKDFIGFRVLEADGDSIDITYRKAGQSEQTVTSGAQVPVADTFYKVGLRYDPAAQDSKKIAFFIDDVEQSDYVTATNIAASTFPDGEGLVPLIGVKNGAAAAKYVDIEYWAFYQEY